VNFAHIPIGPISLNFYGLMYAFGAVTGYFLTVWFSKKIGRKLPHEILSDIIFWGMIGGVIGGRIFYIFAYDFSFFLEHPSQIIAVWNGGMSIHGGLIGGGISAFIFLKKKKFPFWKTVDMFMPALALGLAFGRFGNFINGELPGKLTEMPWGIDFGDGLLRHPSSLYAMGKDILLCGILLLLGIKGQKPGVLTGSFFLLLGCFRFLVEFFREPDPQIGFLTLGLSLGQWLSVFVIFFGTWCLWKTRFFREEKK
jgi:phosphatidylglycerol:prolipoprotein diacylglycerol transferase